MPCVQRIAPVHTMCAIQGRPYQRLQLARRNRLCFGCLSRSHMLTTCDKSRTCNVDGCNKKHSIWLHVNRVRSSIQSNVNDNDGTQSLNVVTFNSCMTGNCVAKWSRTGSSTIGFGLLTEV